MDAVTVHLEPTPKPTTRPGRGGRRPGAGRRRSYRRPVRVLVTLEASELEAIEARWPGLNRSQAIRRAVGRGLAESATESVEAEIEVAGCLIPDTEIKEPDNTTVAPAAPATPTTEDAPEQPEEARTIRMTFEESRMLDRQVMGGHHGCETGLDEPNLWLWEKGVPTCPERGGLMSDTFEHELSLEDCRTLRRAINRWLRSTGDRLARERRIQAQHIQDEKWKPRGQRYRYTPVADHVEKRRREFRKLNGKVRRVLARIPWR